MMMMMSRLREPVAFFLLLLLLLLVMMMNGIVVVGEIHLDYDSTQWDEMTVQVSDFLVKDQGGDESTTDANAVPPIDNTVISYHQLSPAADPAAAWTFGLPIVCCLASLVLWMLYSTLSGLKSKQQHEETFLASLQAAKNIDEIEALVAKIHWPLSPQLWSTIQFHRRFSTLRRTFVTAADEMQPFLSSSSSSSPKKSSPTPLQLPQLLRTLTQAIYETKTLLASCRSSSSTDLHFATIENMLEELQRFRKHLSRLRTSHCHRLKQAIHDENWLDLERAIAQCENYGILDELVQEMDPQTSFALDHDESNTFQFHTICLRIQMKHKVSNALEAADSLEEMKEALQLAKRHGWTHLALYHDLFKAYTTLKEQQYKSHLTLTIRQEEDRLTSLEQQILRTKTSNCNGLQHSTATDRDAVVQELEKAGLDRTEALKLVMSKVADRENILLKIQAEIHLEHQRIVENRRRDAEKRVHAQQLAHEQMQHQAKLHEENNRQRLKRDEAKLRARLELAKQKQEAQRQLDIERFERQETQRLEQLRRQQLSTLHQSDIQHVGWINYCDVLLMICIFLLLFWETVHRMQWRVLDDRCGETRPQEEVSGSSWSSFFFSGAAAGTGVVDRLLAWSCQVIAAIKVSCILIGIGLILFLCSALKQDRLGWMAIGSIALYLFQSHWKKLVYRSYWILPVVVFNQLVKVALVRNTSLHWMCYGIDVRPIVKYIVFPIVSFGLTLVCTVSIACVDPMGCVVTILRNIAGHQD